MRFARATIAAAALALPGAAHAQGDPVQGTWRTGLNDAGNFGYVQIAPCGAAYCGNLVATFDGSGQQIPNPAGRVQIVGGMQPTGDGGYEGATITDPEAGRTFRARMRLSGANALRVSGCVAGGLICRSQTWDRVR